MKPHRSQRRQQGVARARSAQALEHDPVRQRIALAALTSGRRAMGSVGDVVELQRVVGNTAVSRLLAGRSGAGAAPVAVQRVRVDEMKQGLGHELLEKHVGTEPMPDVSNSDGLEQAASAVYYQRPKDVRKFKNTVFFVDPAVLFADLRETNKDAELSGGPMYTTTRTYPAITVLVSGAAYEDPSGKKVQGAVTGPFKKLEIEHGDAKPMVKINKEGKAFAFNHLEKTAPPALATKVDLLESTD